LEIKQIKKKTGGGVWRAFFNGMFGALGYVLGLGLVVLVLAWFLQENGLLSAFEQQVQSFGTLVSEAEKIIAPPSTAPARPQLNNTNSTSTESGETTVTLPNGQQLQVQISQ
jgi:hypothetical protein